MVQQEDLFKQANAPAGVPEVAPPPPNEGGQELLDFLEPDFARFGLRQLSHSQPLGYFLPLLHELFQGGEARTRVVFTLLRELMLDERVRWSRSELDEKFHWLKEGHRNYMLYRLSNVGWLEYYRDQGAYMISDKGEALMRMLSRIALGTELVRNEGAALAEIEFSLMLELNDMPERLTFLKNRLLKHSLRAEAALASESAYRILEIYQQIKNAYRWAEQTRTTLDHIEVHSDDSPTWGAIRGVHQHLSSLHSQIARMQVVLQEIQNQQIDIARYGLTQLDFDNYLINASVGDLAAMLARHLQKVPHPLFVIEANAFAEAHGVLTRGVDGLEAPRGWDTQSTEAEAGGTRDTAPEAEAFARDLAAVTPNWGPVAKLVTALPWEAAAYRFSLLTLLADLDPRSRGSAEFAFDPLIAVPVTARFADDGSLVTLSRPDGDWQHTDGELRRLTPEELAAGPAAAVATPAALAEVSAAPAAAAESEAEPADEPPAPPPPSRRGRRRPASETSEERP